MAPASYLPSTRQGVISRTGKAHNALVSLPRPPCTLDHRCSDNGVAANTLLADSTACLEEAGVLTKRDRFESIDFAIGDPQVALERCRLPDVEGVDGPLFKSREDDDGDDDDDTYAIADGVFSLS